MRKIVSVLSVLLLTGCLGEGNKSYEYIEEEEAYEEAYAEADEISDYKSERSAGAASAKKDMAMAKMAAGKGVLAVLTGQKAPPLPQVTQRMIIKNGDLRLQVDEFDASVQKVQDIAVKQGGFVSSSSSEVGYKGVKEGEVRIRVPSTKFEETMNLIKEIAEKIEMESSSGQDVTEEFFDLEARLDNKKRTEQRFLAILQKAGTIRDILAVETELDQVREAIEQMEGRKKYLVDRVAWSTITVNVHEEFPAYAPTSQQGVFDKLGKGFKKGFYDFFDVIAGIIYILIAGLPVFALIALAIWVVVRIARKYGGKPKEKTAQPPSGLEKGT